MKIDKIVYYEYVNNLKMGDSAVRKPLTELKGQKVGPCAGFGEEPGLKIPRYLS